MDIDPAAPAAQTALFADDDDVVSKDAPESGTSTTEPVSAPSSSESPAPSAPVVVDDSVKQMQGKILKQVEFYFSDVNLPKDKFLLNAVQTTPGGWVSISTLTTFNRLKAITTDASIIASALRQSPEMLEVDAEGAKVRRRTQIKPMGRVSDKSVYVKGFPVDLPNALDEVESFFAAFGPVQYVKVRRDAEKKFKGSVFVEFKSITDAQNVRQMNLSFKDQPLVILTKLEYVQMKEAEYRGKQESGEAGIKMDTDKGRKERKPLPQLDYLPKFGQVKWEPRAPRQALPERPENSLMLFEGVGDMALREDIKAFFERYERVRWIHFKPGETGGTVLMSLPNSSIRVLEELSKKPKETTNGAVPIETEKTKQPAAAEPTEVTNAGATPIETEDRPAETEANGTAEPATPAAPTTTITTVTIEAPNGIAEGTTTVRKATEEEETAFWLEFEKAQAMFRQKKDNRQGRNGE
ncbi:hypothetical protein HK097_004317, partial [Rhizophlyctis rosea]